MIRCERIKLYGKSFGQWTVVDRAHGRRNYWMCRCACGKRKAVHASSLQSGRSRSCGCAAIAASLARRTHGHTINGLASPEYRAWSHMLTRCYNPKANGYERYGGRGIRVCDRWRASFEAFLADMGPRPVDRRSLGRRDNDGHYEPDNCRWETHLEQQNNKSSNRLLTHAGITLTLSEWSRRTGIKVHTLRWRALKFGMDRALAMGVPS